MIFLSWVMYSKQEIKRDARNYYAIEVVLGIFKGSCGYFHVQGTK